MKAEIRRNRNGTLDEIVATGFVHLEQMASNHWWMEIETEKGSIHVNFHSRTSITPLVEDERGL